MGELSVIMAWYQIPCRQHNSLVKPRKHNLLNHILVLRCTVFQALANLIVFEKLGWAIYMIDIVSNTASEWDTTVQRQQKSEPVWCMIMTSVNCKTWSRNSRLCSWGVTRPAQLRTTTASNRILAYPDHNRWPNYPTEILPHFDKPRMSDGSIRLSQQETNFQIAPSGQ